LARISGYAALFASEALIGKDFRERLHPDCFNRTLKENPDVRALLDHDTGRVLGRTKSGTLTLRVDRIGLYFNVDVDETTPDGQTAVGLVGRGDLSGCSFGFRVKSQEWDDRGKIPLRIITDLDLYEVSIVAFPAYDDTVAALVHEAGSRSDSVARARAAMRLRGIPV
jgi:HK97 family phage prohead protease